MTALMSLEDNETEPAAVVVGLHAKTPSQLDQRGRARTIIIGAVMNGALLVLAVACQATRTAIAEMIIMCADNHRLPGQRPGSFEHADDVFYRNARSTHVDLDAGGPTSQGSAARLEVAV